jgi:hypothetical protein
VSSLPEVGKIELSSLPMLSIAKFHDKIRIFTIGGMILTGKHWLAWRKNCLHATLSTAMWAGLGLNQGFFIEGPVIMMEFILCYLTANKW